MKFLLVGINASYSHTCLAVRSICEYVRKGQKETQNETGLGENDIDFVEFTINQPEREVLRGIYEQKPDCVLFSTYIWNAEYTKKIISDLKKILPDVIIGAGGPEFGYAPKVYFSKISELDFIISGEGEKVVNQIVRYGKIKQLEGVCEYLVETDTDKKNPVLHQVLYAEKLICDMSELPFPYPKLNNDEKSKIYYYESSRGCPFSCSYCISSIDKHVRFMPLERVFSDIQRFLDAKVPLIKFVDRTYNLNPERYIKIWDFILTHHNGVTMFHFEIEAETLSEDALDFLQKVPAGVMQFEIGVQSANKKTLRSINRSDNIEKLAEKVGRIPRTIHQHLDLIVGLPYENLTSFGKSFDFVMSLKPDALQLGFLKILHGTTMEKYAFENGWKWNSNPVYEVLSTPYLSFSDLLFLKDVEILVDAYWNSGIFKHFMSYVDRKIGLWNFFSALAKDCRASGVFNASRRETYWFELIGGESSKDESETGLPLVRTLLLTTPSSGGHPRNAPVYLDLLRYDFLLRGKQGGFPSWYTHRYNKLRHQQLLDIEFGISVHYRLGFAKTEYELFDCNVDSETPEKNIGSYEKLIKY